MKGTNEVSVSYGIVSGTDMVTALNGGDDLNYTPISNTGNIFGTYRYFLGDRVSLGFTAGYPSFNNLWNDTYNTEATYKQKESMATFGPELKYITLDGPHFQLYTLLGVAGTYRNETNAIVTGPVDFAPQTNFTWNVQLTPIGVSFGGNVGGYVEPGIGHKGLLNSGVYYKLPKRKAI